MSGVDHTDELRRAEAAVLAVADPELPFLSIADLGILRGVALRDSKVEVTITPTYTGCPAMTVIAIEVEAALAAAGITDARVRSVLTPAWTTEWLTEAGRAKLAAAGIVPPDRATSRRALFGVETSLACPLCGSPETERISHFGSTACKALHRCLACREPFEAFKCH